MDNSTDRVVPLDQMDDFKVAEGDPDVRGWDVLSAEGTKIGEVDDLLVDSAAMKVRYLDVDIEDDLSPSDPDRHILIPIGYARLDESADQILVDTLRRSDLDAIPAYTHGPLTREYETTLRAHFDNGGELPRGDVETRDIEGREEVGGGSDFYGSDLYSEDRFYSPRRAEGERRMTRSEEELEIGKRDQRAGELVLDKHVESEHVRENVPVRHEEAIVERHPITDEVRAEGRISEEEIHIPLSEEELVVEKRAIPKEEILVHKEDRFENETVEADLRRERVDVRREGRSDSRDER